MRAARTVVAAILAVGVLFLMLRWLERSMMFPAPRAGDAPALGPAAQQTWLKGDDFQAEAFLLLPPQLPAGRRAPLLIYAHGNGELVDYWLGEFDAVRAQGLAVLLVEYPGYGRSLGEPSEDSIRRAFMAGYDWALSDPRIDANRVVGHGFSLGGGAIGALARERRLAALVLQSTFASVPTYLTEQGAPWTWGSGMVVNVFDTLGVVQNYAGPVLVMHGELDTLIPPVHGRRLAEAARDATLVTLRCGHNDCPPQWPAVIDFLGKRGLLQP